MTDVDDYALVFAKLTGELLGGKHDEAVTALSLVQQLPEVLPAADHVSITVARRSHHYETLGSSSPTALACDEIQYELGEGPCIEALSDAEWYRSGDVAVDRRWPQWGPRAAEIGVASLLSIRLMMGARAVGALNCYSEKPGEFGDHEDLDVAFLYALHAAAALGAAQEIHGLQTAMQSRHTIGVAQGVLMGKYGLTLERSFEVLRRYSSTRNIKLRDLSAYVVEHGELPSEDGPPSPENRGTGSASDG